MMMSRIPFNLDHEADAAEAIALVLRANGHDARAEYVGSNTSVIVQLSDTSEVLLAGWGDLDGWVAQFQAPDEQAVWQVVEDRCTDVPGTKLSRADQVAVVLTRWLSGQYPEGYGPSPTPLPAFVPYYAR